MQVVIVDERNASGKLWIRSAAKNLFDTLLSGFIGRMSLAGKDQLNWPARVIEETHKPILIVKDQCRALVVGKPPGKSDGQGGRIEKRSMSCELSGAGLLPDPSITHMFADKTQKMHAQRLTCVPQFFVRDAQDPFPDLRIVLALSPILSEIVLKQAVN